jgi:hypothetical protein
MHSFHLLTHCNLSPLEYGNDFMELGAAQTGLQLGGIRRNCGVDGCYPYAMFPPPYLIVSSHI